MGKIEVRGLTKSYGATQVIPQLDLSVRHGEFCVLVGPSGCGKSTLLRAIAGLEEIDSGQIEIGDRRVEAMAPKDRDIAMVFQNYALYPTMTVYQNMSFSLRLRRESKKTIEEKVTNAADILGMRELLDRFPKELSGGQRQRVAMGRAIVRDPQAFLFDEPLSNLDAKLRASMRSEIKSLHQRLGATTIYVTHDQIEAMTMADRIVVLQSGHIEQIGTPQEIYNHPVNQFVAGFIGSPSMNFLSGCIINDGHGDRFVTDSGSEIQFDSSGVVFSKENLTLGFRPEAAVVQHVQADGDQCWRVGLVEPTGAVTLLNLESRGETVGVAVNANNPLRTGDSVRIVVDGASVHLFDREGRRVDAVTRS